MKRFLLIVLIVFVGAAGWNVGSQLSRDTVSLALGIVLGVLAGLPVALLVLAANRRADRGREPQDYPRQQAQQPPIIMLAGQGQAGQYPGQQQQYLPGPPRQQAGQWHSAPAASYDFWEGEQSSEDW